MIRDYTNFPLSSLILQYQTFCRKLEEKKSSGKTLTAKEKQTDQDINNQIRMRIVYLKNISKLEERKPYLFYHTIFPPNVEIMILGKKLRGTVIGYEGENLAIISLIDRFPDQPTIKKIAVPFNQLQLLYVEI